LGCRIKARSDDDVSNASNFIIHIFDGTNNISTMIAEKSGKTFFTSKDKSPYLHAPGLPDFSWYNIPKREKYIR
jgi:hypothetical protein